VGFRSFFWFPEFILLNNSAHFRDFGFRSRHFFGLVKNLANRSMRTIRYADERSLLFGSKYH